MVEAEPGGAPDRATRGASARWAVTFLPPVAAFLTARAVLSLAASATGYGPLLPASWTRWDSMQYLDIATAGYHLELRPEGPWGNTGWLPGYPYAVRALATFGLAPTTAGVIVSAVFELAMLFLVWRRWLGGRATARGLLALLAVALSVGSVYRHAVFPLSAVAFLAALQAELAAARRWIGAGLAGAAAAFTYSTVFFLAPVAVAAICLDRGVPWPRRLVAAATVGGITFAGFGAVLLIHRLEVGTWNAFFLIQGRYGHALQSPLETLGAYLLTPDAGDGVLAAVRRHVVVSSTFVAMIVACAVVSVRRGGPAVDRWAALYAISFFLFPLAFGPAVNPVRSVSFLAPAAITLRWLPTPALATWISITGLAVFEMARLYFLNTLV